jgi:uncharacterized membrane protein YdbT with pleckstrin-like domain
MGISPKLLSEGERVILSTRTHWKALILPALVLIVTVGLASFLVAILPSGDAHDILMWLVIAAAAIVIGWFSLWPFLRWLTSSYTVTNKRLITRTGVITRTGRDIPLYRINDVSHEKHLVDRILGCGTLVISAASEQGQSVLPDVPRVEELQLLLHELLHGAGESGNGSASRETGQSPR